jgi:hypothetical protein
MGSRFLNVECKINEGGQMAKKLSMVILAVLATVFLCGNVVAVPGTWVDDSGYIHVLLDSYANTTTPNNYIQHHSLIGAGFDPLQDLVTSYSLTIWLRDDQAGDGAEKAKIDLPGITADGYYYFSYDSNDYGMSVLGWVLLNLTGKLDVTILACKGDFYFDRSILTAEGCETNPTSVPEGNAMIVLGAGLFGLGGCARRMFKS